jgi:hypothetical protein
MSPKRRTFLKRAALLALAGGEGLRGVYGAEAGRRPGRRPVRWRVRRQTDGPKHHFFGYYGICPWSRSGRYLLCLESTFQDRLPRAEEPAKIALVDSRTGELRVVGETRAWNLQQGAMLHWNPTEAEHQIIHNDHLGDEVVSVVLDTRTGRRRRLPRPVSAVSRSGEHALSLTYGRLGRLRRVVGYGAARDPYPDDPAPREDGVFRMDLRTGEVQLVVSLAEVYERLLPANPSLRGQHLWFNHTVYNRDDSRFLFLARAYLPPDRKRHTAMFTASVDGGELRQVIPMTGCASHFDWRNDREIVATYEIERGRRKHVLFTDGASDHRVIGGGFLDFDGHCHFSPDGTRLVTDRKHREALEQSLLLYDMEAQEGVELCRFDMREERYLSGNVRCDFHPRWNRTGDQICFDAIEPQRGTRQLHVVDLVG